MFIVLMIVLAVLLYGANVILGLPWLAAIPITALEVIFLLVAIYVVWKVRGFWNA